MLPSGPPPMSCSTSLSSSVAAAGLRQRLAEGRRKLPGDLQCALAPLAQLDASVGQGDDDPAIRDLDGADVRQRHPALRISEVPLTTRPMTGAPLGTTRLPDIRTGEPCVQTLHLPGGPNRSASSTAPIRANTPPLKSACVSFVTSGPPR